MAEPKLTVIGVYRPTISAETWLEQRQIAGNDEATRDHFRGLVLIEAVIEGMLEAFDLCKFGQTDAKSPDDRSSMQVGYDEGLLSSDGETLIEREMGCVEGPGQLRFAVYLHFYDPARPVLWQYGEVTCPPVQEMPDRLSKLMPYNPTD